MKPPNESGGARKDTAAHMNRSQTNKPDNLDAAVKADDLERAAFGIDYAIKLLLRNEMKHLGIWLNRIRRALP